MENNKHLSNEMILESMNITIRIHHLIDVCNKLWDRWKGSHEFILISWKSEKYPSLVICQMSTKSGEFAASHTHFRRTVNHSPPALHRMFEDPVTPGYLSQLYPKGPVNCTQRAQFTVPKRPTYCTQMALFPNGFVPKRPTSLLQPLHNVFVGVICKWALDWVESSGFPAI